MKEYIIIPTTQTEGMFGYSAVAIENTPENLKHLDDMYKTLDVIRQTDAIVSGINYDNARLDFTLLNEDFEPMTDTMYLEEIDDDRLEEIEEEGKCSLECGVVKISNYGVRISFDAEHSDAQVYCEFTMEDLNEVLTDN